MPAAHVLSVANARGRGVGELHVLAGLERLRDPRFEPGHLDPVSAVGLRQPGERVVVVIVKVVAHGVGDEQREQVGQFLALQHGVLKIPDRAQAQQDARQWRDAAQLAWPLDLVDMRHLTGGHAEQVAVARLADAVAGVVLVEPERGAGAKAVALDALVDRVALRQARPHGGVKHRAILGLDQLDLHRHAKWRGQVARAAPHEHLAAVKQRAAQQHLLAVDVEHAVGVRLPTELIPDRAVLGALETRLDAGADQVGHPLLGTRLGGPIVAHRVMHAAAHALKALQRLLRAAGWGVPPRHAPAHPARVVAVGGLSLGPALNARHQ